MGSSFQVELVIGTSTHTNHLVPGTINLYDNLDARTALSFQLKIPSSDTRPSVGQPVYLASSTSGSTCYIFGGSLDNYTETVLNPLGSTDTRLILNCNAVDFTQMLNKRVVYKSYPSSGLGEYNSVAATSSFVTDGVTRTWALAYPLSAKPVMKADGIAVSPSAISTFISPSTFVWFYEPSSFLINAATTNSAPGAGTTMDVIYTAIVGVPAWDTDIIRDINTNFFDGEGINCSSVAGRVLEGIRIPEINFNYMPGNEALNLICEMSGRSWYIDPWKQMHYFPRAQNAAPFAVSSTSNNWRSLTVKRSRDKYRNKEYVIGSYGYIPTTETFTGDGQTRTFTLSWPVYDTPVVLVDGFKADVGLLGIATSTVGYYWQRESKSITGNSTNTALASTDTLTVKYLGLYPVVAVAADGDEISNRAAIEGNSGIYEEATNSNKTYVDTAAIAYGSAILSKYGKPLDQVEFETDIDGLASGQLIHIKVSDNSLDDYYYIISVTARDVGMATLRYKVVAVSGQDRGGWLSFFRDLVTGNNSLYTEPYINLVQTTLTPVYGNIKFTDGVTVAVTVIVIALYDTAEYDTGTYA